MSGSDFLSVLGKIFSQDEKNVHTVEKAKDSIEEIFEESTKRLEKEHQTQTQRHQDESDALHHRLKERDDKFQKETKVYAASLGNEKSLLEKKRLGQKEKHANETTFHEAKMKEAYKELNRKKSELSSKTEIPPQTPSKPDGFGADFGRDFGKESSSDEE